MHVNPQPISIITNSNSNSNSKLLLISRKLGSTGNEPIGSCKHSTRLSATAIFDSPPKSPTMASIYLFLSLLTSLLFSCSMAITSAHNQTWTSYIRTSCSHTLYPGLCYASLSPYARRVGSNPVLLSRFAMNVTLARLKPLSVRMASLRQRAALAPSYSYSGNGSSTPTLKDNCGEFMSHATDLVRNSEKEVTGLEEKVGPEVMWRISNVQTWLSAALTYEETCTDEIDEEGSGGTSTGEGEGEDVEQLCKKLKRVKQLTSNALALVNCLVN